MVQRVPLGDVRVLEERRATVKEFVVAALMTSVERRGLLSPIRVRADGRLILGLHRLVVHERLGLAEIDAIICDGDDIELELDEIEENLARKELTVLERAIHERRQKELYILRRPTTQRGVAGAVGRHDPQAKGISFAADRSERGSGRRMVEQRVQIADALSPETTAQIADKPIANNHTQLVALARVPPNMRHDVAKRIATGAAANVEAAVRALSGGEPPVRAKPLRYVEGMLVTDEDGARVANVSFRGRDTMLVVEPDGAFTLEDRGPTIEKPKPSTHDDRVLTLPISLQLPTEALAELPGDLAPFASIAKIATEWRTRCGRCGGTDFWRTRALQYACVECRPTEWRSERDIRDRVNIRAPRFAQTITVKRSRRSDWPDARIEVRWWHAPDRLGGAPRDAVLVEMIATSRRETVIFGDRPTSPRAEQMREALRIVLLDAYRLNHGLREKNGRYIRDDGSEVALVPNHGTALSGPTGGER